MGTYSKKLCAITFFLNTAQWCNFDGAKNKNKKVAHFAVSLTKKKWRVPNTVSQLPWLVSLPHVVGSAWPEAVRPYQGTFSSPTDTECINLLLLSTCSTYNNGWQLINGHEQRGHMRQVPTGNLYIKYVHCTVHNASCKVQGYYSVKIHPRHLSKSRYSANDSISIISQMDQKGCT